MAKDNRKRINFSIGICAYNEGNNIGLLIRSIQKQNLANYQFLKEIIVVASGCTDNTEEIVKNMAVKDNRIKIIVQKKRKGKASAVNRFLASSKSPRLILASADLILEKNCLRYLIDTLSMSQVCLVAAQVVPLNKGNDLISFAVKLQWNLHHKINLQFPDRPKVGELIAFKKIFKKIPVTSAVDEASIEPLIYFQGYKVKYCPDAIVYNKGPETVRDFLSQRRRIYAGHADLSRNYGYKVVTYSNLRVLGTLLANVEWNKRFFLYTPLVIMLEAVGRGAGFIDCMFKRRSHAIWKIAKTTKKLT